MNMLKIFILTATPKNSMDFLFKCPFPINVQRATPLFSHCQKKKTTTEIHAYEQIPAITAALSMAG